MFVRFYSLRKSVFCRNIVLPKMSDVDVRAIVPSLVAVANFLSNVPAFVLLVSSRKLKKDISTGPVASLFLADIGMGGVGPMISAGVAWRGPDYKLSRGLTALLGCVFTSASLSAVWHLALISVIRCSVIVRPLTYWSFFTPRLLCLILSALWGGSIMTSVVLELIGATWIFNRGTLTAFFYYPGDRIVGFIYILINLVVPGVVITIAYLKIYLVVRSHVRTIHAGNSNGTLQLTVSSVKSAKNLFAMIGVYTVTYLPIFSLLFQQAYPAWYTFTANWLYYFNATLNSLLYVVLHKNVKAEYQRLMCRCFRKEGDHLGAANSVTAAGPETVLTVARPLSAVSPSSVLPTTV